VPYVLGSALESVSAGQRPAGVQNRHHNPVPSGQSVRKLWEIPAESGSTPAPRTPAGSSWTAMPQGCRSPPVVGTCASGITPAGSGSTPG